MEINIRKACADDAAYISELCKNGLGYDCTVEFVMDKLNKLDLNREAVFAAAFDEKVIGFIHIEKYDTLYFETLVNVLGIAVDTHYRRCGIGKKLISAAELWAKEIGASAIRLNSGASRTQAHSFYRAVGFDSEKQQLRFLKRFDLEK